MRSRRPWRFCGRWCRDVCELRGKRRSDSLVRLGSAVGLESPTYVLTGPPSPRTEYPLPTPGLSATVTSVPDAGKPNSYGRSRAHSVAGRAQLSLDDPRIGKAVAPQASDGAFDPLERRRDRLRLLQLS